ncbi:MAG: hypothetical protein IJ433_06900 [Ruminococcus sp.]|nr:hypothetical protein [Ruminococcus sp.]
MKNRLIRTGAAILAMATLCSASTLSSFAASTSNTRTVDYTVYYTENGEDKGIKSIEEDGVLYYDVVNNTKTDVTTDYLKKYLTTEVEYLDPDGPTGKITPLTQWAEVAGAIFENGGKYTCTDNYSTYYGKNFESGSTENNYVAGNLANPKAVSVGDKKCDSYKSTGLSVASSLENLRYKMCEEISSSINRYTLDPEDILSQGDNCPDALPEFADDTNREILYNIVTAISRNGKTCKYKYNSYGVAFFDFDLKIINAKGVEYVQDPSRAKQDSSVKTSVVNTIKNNALYDISAQTTTEMSKSETVSTSISNSESYSFAEMFGGHIEFGNKFVKGLIESSLTTTQAYESARTDETTVLSSVSQSESVDCLVPQHTIVNVEQSISTDSMTLNYDTPVALTYKVAVFSMSGDVYADSIATLALSTAGYSQSNFSTFFGGDSSKEGFYAYDSLANKVANASTPGWDSSNGNNHFFYKYHNGKSDQTDRKDMDLDWTGICNTYNNNKSAKDKIADFANKCPMLPAGTTTTVTVEAINTTLSEPVPMYLPTSFKVTSSDNPRYYCFTGGTFNLGTISINAFDRFGAEYYDFLPSDGYWSVKAGSEDIVEFDSASYCVKAKNPGSATLVWQLKDGVEYTAEYENGIVTNANANPVEITITVRDYPLNK